MKKKVTKEGVSSTKCLAYEVAARLQERNKNYMKIINRRPLTIRIRV